MLKIFSPFMLAAVLWAPAAPTLAADVPTTLDGVTVVDAAQAKALQAQGAIMVDTRVAVEYAQQTIPGAINISYREKSAKSVDFDAGKDKFDLKKLPADKKTSLVVFCNGPECWKSYKSSSAMRDAGYTNIHWFRGGMPAWVAQGLPTQ